MRAVLYLGLFVANMAHAGLLSSFFQTNNQTAQTLLQKGQYKQAANLFTNPQWQASAQYRAGDYENAAKNFHQLADNNAPYNEGNALAHLGQYEKAIEAYNRALVLDPQNKDAQFNRDLVQALLEKQKQQQQQQQQQQQKPDSSKDNKQDSQSQDKPQNNNADENKDKNDKKDNQEPKQPKDQQDKKDQKQNSTPDKASAQQAKAQQEKQMAKQQWLNLIPDDPGGLLREKFLRDHYRRLHGWNQ